MKDPFFFATGGLPWGGFQLSLISVTLNEKYYIQKCRFFFS